MTPKAAPARTVAGAAEIRAGVRNTPRLDLAHATPGRAASMVQRLVFAAALST
jgi:hypothetical protein